MTTSPTPVAFGVTSMGNRSIWETIARGGLERALFPWGSELEPGGEHRCTV